MTALTLTRKKRDYSLNRRFIRMLKREASPGEYVIMTALAIFTMLPIVYMISTAFKPLEEMFIYPPRFLVRHPTGRNFVELLLAIDSLSVPFARYMFNSLFVAAATVTASVILSSMAAYPLAKYPRMPGAKLFFSIVVSTLMFAPEVTQIPRYLIVDRLGMIDTYWGLIIPALAGSYGLFLMKQFMEQLPIELIEAAKVDGASELRIFFQIVMPLVRPAWITLIIFSFIGTWNDFFTPLIFTRSEQMKTLPLMMSSIGGGPGVVARWGAVAAASLVVTLPVLILFVVLQRFVMQTMAYSGIKS
jgi:ABC-type glycerol-3-phosphate transport system permease component